MNQSSPLTGQQHWVRRGSAHAKTNVHPAKATTTNSYTIHLELAPEFHRLWLLQARKGRWRSDLGCGMAAYWLACHTSRRPSRVNRGSTAVISGSLEAISCAYPPVATTGNRRVLSSRFNSVISSRISPR